MPVPDRSNHYMIEGHDILPKGLDLQRNGSETEAAKVNAAPGQIMKTMALIKSAGNTSPVPLPKGMNHIMINPK